eukprot:CAMPEP_0172318656 /NCGR_PEP_ID=MMETSP1058-20130122/35482_1 /TAXON_ID=83371 /ORGANISM="Detonula confervacea, Strain CCMP 353" /LENGTH=61 /DNA_ID=CAMNT_0013033535 /DNA_START=412 /DNA_END=597 /DNA_ORIENTATION=+
MTMDLDRDSTYNRNRLSGASLLLIALSAYLPAAYPTKSSPVLLHQAYCVSSPSAHDENDLI